MSVRAQSYAAQVASRVELDEHLVRLVLAVDGFTSTGVADEWIGLVIPGQFQSRYYTVADHDDRSLTLDVVVHDHGLVTTWARGSCVGDDVMITEPKASFAPPADATWIVAVGDLTAAPAMARIARTTHLPVSIWAETPAHLVASYFPESATVTHVDTPAGTSRLAEVVESLTWPEGPGYFWMAGESAQMRAIRKQVMRERILPSTHYDVMGYWRGVERRQPRAVDPGPIWAAGKAAGHSDEQIWAAYDRQREREDES